jgi:hypothetical protein
VHCTSGAGVGGGSRIRISKIEKCKIGKIEISKIQKLKFEKLSIDFVDVSMRRIASAQAQELSPPGQLCGVCIYLACLRDPTKPPEPVVRQRHKGRQGSGRKLAAVKKCIR